MVLGRLWRKSAPELMGAELLIMFVLIVWLWSICGVYSQEMDGVGFSLKNNVSVHRLCIRAPYVHAKISANFMPLSYKNR